MTERQAWFCPSCQKHHAPHVDTCPGGTGGVHTLPGVNVWPITVSPYIPPNPTTGDPQPWMPYWTSCGVSNTYGGH